MSPLNLINAITRLFDAAPFATATAGIGVVALLAGLLTTLLVRELESTGAWLALVGLGLLLLALLDTLRRSNSPAAKRRRKYGFNVALMLATFIAILGVVNFLAVRSDVRFDTTFSQQFTLAEQTKNVLDGLEHEVEATAFFIDRFEDVNQLQSALRDRTENLLREFERIWQEFERYWLLEQYYGVPIAGNLAHIPYRSWVQGRLHPPEQIMAYLDFATVWLDK